jgi:cytochrome P450
MAISLPQTATLKTPPTLPGLPILGNTLAFMKEGGVPVKVMEAAAKRYGDIVRMQVSGSSLYVIAHPNLTQEILVKRVNEFHKPLVLTETPTALERFLGRALLTADYAEWKPQRKLIQPLMHTKHIESYAGTMVNFGNQLLASWHNSETRDIHADMTQVTMWIIADTMFGTDVSNSPELERAGQEAQAITVGDVFMPLPNFLMGARNRKSADINKVLSALVARLMNERRTNGSATEERSDLLTLLMQTTDEDGNPMPDEFIRNNILTLFFAGHETTANTLTWAFHYLDRNPQVLETLQAEVDTVLQGRTPTLADLRNLPYTLMVIKETMRIEPTVSVIPRALIDDVALDGYLLKKGSTVMLSPYLLHRDPRWWKDPEVFDPTRFSEVNEPNIPKYAYLPFGGGPRICIGNHFSLMESQILMAVIVSRYHLTLAPSANIVPLRQVTTAPKYGLQMIVKERQKIIAVP